jgi:hypothetical protein
MAIWERAEAHSIAGPQCSCASCGCMARWTAERAIDMIRDRFGWDAVGYGSVLLGPFACGLLALFIRGGKAQGL